MGENALLQKLGNIKNGDILYGALQSPQREVQVRIGLYCYYQTLQS